jgi:hypothetical protein
MKRVAFALVGLAALMSTGCCLPKLPCCWVSAIADIISVLGIALPTAT